MNLYEISEKYREAILEISEMDPEDMTDDEQRQRIAETLGNIEDDFRLKAVNIGSHIVNLEIEIDSLKAMEERLLKGIQARRKTAEKKAAWLTSYLHSQMTHLGFGEIKDDQIRLRIKKTPPRVVVEDENIVPDDYKETKVEVLVRKTLIGEALKAGQTVPGAHLQAGTRLEIR